MLYIIQDFWPWFYKTPYVNANNMDGAVKSLEEVTTKFLEWYSNNLMESNADKYHLLLSTNNTVIVRLEKFDIKSL